MGNNSLLWKINGWRHYQCACIAQTNIKEDFYFFFFYTAQKQIINECWGKKIHLEIIKDDKWEAQGNAADAECFMLCVGLLQRSSDVEHCRWLCVSELQLLSIRSCVFLFMQEWGRTVELQFYCLSAWECMKQFKTLWVFFPSCISTGFWHNTGLRSAGKCVKSCFGINPLRIKDNWLGHAH